MQPQTSAYETVIGLETHIQLSTASKAFCGDSAAFGGTPNTQVSIISLAHPGTLPRLNRKVVEYAIRLGLALGCTIKRCSTFDRKNYFYADLPKGYQITQDRNPICLGGQLNIGGRHIRIHHIHIEEDAGKSTHDQHPTESLIDLNRAGVALLEVVTEPDFRSADEVAAYMEYLRRLVRWLDISDGNMEEGSLRCDVNISVRRVGATTFGQRCEIKNMNSMRFAKRAIEYEVARQIAVLESGDPVEQETRGYDPASGHTFSLREKESAHDYRYFPEPDLPPVLISEAFLEQVQSALPTLPQALEQHLQTHYALPAYDASLLTQERDTATYFLRLADAVGPELTAEERAIRYKSISNLLINRLLPWAAAQGVSVSDCPVSPAQWVDFLHLIDAGQVSASSAYQRLYPVLLERPELAPGVLAAELNLVQSADSDFLATLVEGVLARFPEKVAEYRKGKKGLLGMFMGEVMKASGGKADPKATTRLLEERLKA